MGGVVSPIVDFGNDVVGAAGDVGQGAIDTVKDAGRSIDQTVRNTLPGGWTTAALLGAGYYYSPEIGAYISSDGTSMAAATDVAAADAAASAAPQLTGYDAAMADLAASAPMGAETAAGLGLGGSLAAGAAGAAALGSMMIPDVPGMAASYTPPKKYEADYSVKFDDPVKQMQVPDSFDFQLDSTPSPYLTMSQTGPNAGPMLFNPNEAYNSNLIRGLRAASNAPESVNPGFTLFQSAKP